ncbi:MAG: hypothetical protein R3Y13_04940 [bacterium]
MIKIIKQIPLMNCNCNLYTGTIFSGNSYKLLMPINKEMELLTKNYTSVCKKKLCYEYKNISYSKNTNEYLLTKLKDTENIYIVDEKFNELEKIKLKIVEKYKKEINSISYAKEDCKIYICLKDCVYSVTMQGDFIKEELSRETKNELNMRILNSYTRCNNQNVGNINITCANYIQGDLYIGYKKNCSGYISKISKCGNIQETYYIDDEIEINEIFKSRDNIELLITKQCKYNYLYVSNKCINNGECLHKCCSPEKKCCNKCKEEKCDPKCEVKKIIESIALIEASLAQLLCVESEKVKKIIKISDKPSEIINVNDSVSRTITNITMLEQMLTEKLSIALNSIDIKNKK